MAAIAFDTLKAARRLKEAGVPEAAAEAHAEIMAEAFVFNMDTLVTQDYLDARFAEQDARMDQKLGALEARINHELAEVRGDIKVLKWMLAAVALSTFIPFLRDVFSLI